MILTLIQIAFIVVGLVAYKLDRYGDFDFDFWGVLTATFGIISLIISIVIIIMSHALAGKTIYNNQIYYDSLCKRLEVVQSDYEDVSKSVVIADIAEWNKEVYNTKYWAESPWTNWFNPREIADNMDYISLEEE